MTAECGWFLWIKRTKWTNSAFQATLSIGHFLFLFFKAIIWYWWCVLIVEFSRTLVVHNNDGRISLTEKNTSTAKKFHIYFFWKSWPHFSNLIFLRLPIKKCYPRQDYTIKIFLIEIILQRLISILLQSNLSIFIFTWIMVITYY